MSEDVRTEVVVRLPAELAARVEELKQDREEDRDKSLSDLVQEMCRSYVRVRELARLEMMAHAEIERSYQERPSDYDDADEWGLSSSPDKEAKP